MSGARRAPHQQATARTPSLRFDRGQAVHHVIQQAAVGLLALRGSTSQVEP